MRIKAPIILISLTVLLLMAFLPSEILFKDDFEGRFSAAKLKRDYQVWDAGATLNIFIEDKIVNSGKKGLGIEIISPNPLNQSTYGSVFRTMELFMGNWSGADGVRFWISNPNDSPLLLSFNLKERYREYWAVAEEGIFYFQNEEGTFSQQAIFYNNLPIPADFSGFLVLPFESLEVPSWNTAKGNQHLDTNQIESYAFSITVGEQTPFTFYIDDFEVMGPTTFYQLPISGVTHLKIPPSGDLIEPFTASLVSLDNQKSNDTNITWSIQEPYDPIINITKEGELRVPANTSDNLITLVAQTNTPEFNLKHAVDITLEGADSPQGETPPVKDPASLLVVEPDSPYDRFSQQFDAWTSENRGLFVTLLILGVTLFLFMLSYIEHQLKKVNKD